MRLENTRERLIPSEARSLEDRIMVFRHVFAYDLADRLLPAAGNVLDLGSGEGYGSTRLDTADRKIVGVDVAADAALHAQKSYPAATFTLYDGCTLPFADDSFDAVVAFQMIEHVERDADLVSEIGRVLRPDGLLVLTTPNRVTRIAEGAKPWNRFHLREYSARELETLLRRAFPIVEVQGVRAVDWIERAEHRRVKRYQRTGWKYPLQIAGRLAARAVSRFRTSTAVPVSLDDFRLSAEADAAMDLFAVARLRSA